MKAFLTRRKSLLVAASAALALSLSACGGSTSSSNPPVAEKPSFAADTTMAKLSSADKIIIENLNQKLECPDANGLS